ncbi:MAG: hypothetical protein K2Y22_03905 [Candidatus Obscuribacterales bacterium]|nr:hypothetical protein [Candidatus Obscuribacterales bacterium]
MDRGNANDLAKALEFVSQVMIEAANNPQKYADELIKAGLEADGFSKRTTTPWALPSMSEMSV